MEEHEEIFPDLEDDSPVEANGVHAHVPAPAQTPSVRVARGRRKKEEPAAVGLGRLPKSEVVPKGGWRNRELEFLWPEILERLQETGHEPNEISINIARLDPPPRVVVGRLDGYAAVGDGTRSPGEILVELITERFHLYGRPQAAMYEITFYWKSGGVMARGTLNLDSPDIIMAIRRGQQGGYPGAPAQTFAGPYTPPGYAPPPQYQQYQQPQYHQPYGFGAPYYPPPQQPNVAELESKIGYLQGTLDEVLKAHREGREPVIQPAPPPPPPVPVLPPQPPMDIESIVARTVAVALKTAGVGLGAPQPVQPPQDPMRPMMERIVKAAVDTVGMAIEKSVKQSIGVGAPPVIEEDEPETPEAPKPEDKVDDLPFSVTELQTTWADGRKVGYARNKETGDIDWMGVAVSNPFIAEKLVDTVGNGLNNLLNSAGEAIKRIGTVPGPGLGSPPSQPPPPPQFQPQTQSHQLPDGEGPSELPSL